jgi:prophage tail gpP-like protein
MEFEHMGKRDLQIIGSIEGTAARQCAARCGLSVRPNDQTTVTAQLVHGQRQLVIVVHHADRTMNVLTVRE